VTMYIVVSSLSYNSFSPSDSKTYHSAIQHSHFTFVVHQASVCSTSNGRKKMMNARATDIKQHYRNGKGKVTPQMYADVLDEVDQVTKELTDTRSKLWQTQDDFKEAEYAVVEMEKKLADLMEAHDVDQESIKLLREANSSQVEEELRLRDSLELMKKVFTRTQLKTKDDHDKIQNLKEEIELQMEENQKLRGELDQLRTIMTKPGQPTDRENRLQEALDKTRRELESASAKQGIAEENIKIMTKRMLAQPANMELVLSKHRQEIEALQKKIKELEPDVVRSNSMDPEVDKASPKKERSWFSFDYVTCSPRVVDEEVVVETPGIQSTKVFAPEPVAQVFVVEDVVGDGDSQVEQREEGSVVGKDTDSGVFSGIRLWARE
jgi:septal ring factor EnvC (AmiA/AmiB activator)